MSTEVLDALAEVVVFADGPVQRATVVAAVVTELAALVSWSQPGDGLDTEEMAGKGRVVAAAVRHLTTQQAQAQRQA